MKFALINGIKTEAIKGAKGICPSCGSELIAKCGEVIINHWSHKGNRNCDLWWENETEWHRAWKDNFPIEWQEVVQFDKNGEKHIADVKTDEGWVIEFQHSYLKPEERRSRNGFYKKIVWVVDGSRKRDLNQFQQVIDKSRFVPEINIPIRKVNYLDDSKLLNEWVETGVPVFFDFQELEDSKLWFLLPNISKRDTYLIPFSRKEFIELHRINGFDEVTNKILPNIRIIISSIERSNSLRTANQIMNSSNKRKRSRRF